MPVARTPIPSARPVPAATGTSRPDEVRLLLRKIARERGERWLLREAEIIAMWSESREH